MTEFTWGIAGGLGAGMTWAATSMLARSLSGVLTPAGISAVRATIGGSILVVLALATGHAGEVVRMPLWVVLTLWVSIIAAMGIGDPLFFASMDHLGVSRALILGMANPLLTTLVGIGLLREPVTLPRAAGILLVVGGLVLIIAGRGDGGTERRATRQGMRLVFWAAGLWAVSAVILKPALQIVTDIDLCIAHMRKAKTLELSEDGLAHVEEVVRFHHAHGDRPDPFEAGFYLRFPRLGLRPLQIKVSPECQRDDRLESVQDGKSLRQVSLL